MRNPDILITLAEEMRRPLEMYLKCRQVRERMERGLKTIFAECFLEVEKGTIEERKSRALIHPRYIEAIAELDMMEKKEVAARVEYDNLHKSFDAYQSALSYDKEMLKKNM